MRLLNAETLAIEEFLENNTPKYAILSHTWGDEEVSLQQFLQPGAATRAGYVKIRKTCEQALKRGLRYAWVDTCCIDKTSSAELTEAINSMFRWYEQAEVCFAYLVDVPPAGGASDIGPAFEKSRWFSRGWTLQELLAPPSVEFFASDWTFLSTRSQLAGRLRNITRIDESYLAELDLDYRRGLLNTASIAERMSWAAKRTTSRAEDTAYCLLGIFGVNMPLIYGEGDKAFLRLQETILQNSLDLTLLAWTPKSSLKEQIFAPSPFLPWKQAHTSFIENWILFHEVPSSFSRWQLAWKTLIGTDHPWYCVTAMHVGSQSDIGFLAPSPDCFSHYGDAVACDADTNWSLSSNGLNIDLPANLPSKARVFFSEYHPTRRRNSSSPKPISVFKGELALLYLSWSLSKRERRLS